MTRPGYPAENKFTDGYTVDHVTNCWVWTAGLNTDGYPVLRHPGGKREYAHRYSYRTCVAAIPAGLVVDHLCRNTTCVKPKHLEAVEQGTNVRRGARRHPSLLKPKPPSAAREARKAAGLSIVQLAERAQCSVGTIQRIENRGHRRPRRDVAERIAAVLRVDASDLFDTPSLHT